MHFNGTNPYTHDETWVLFIPPPPIFPKLNYWDGCKRQFLSFKIMPELYI